MVGAHARGFNTGTFGVSVLGNFDQAWVSSDALEGVVQIMSWKFAVHDIDPRQDTWIQAGAGSPVYAPGTWIPTPRVFSHRDVGQTSCPGGYLYYWLGAVRDAVNQRAPGMMAPGAAVGGNFVGGPETDVFIRQPGVQLDTLNAGSTGGFFGWRYYNVDGSYWGVPGDFDGNGYDDIYWYAPGAGTDWIWLSDGNDFWQYVSASNSSLQAALVGDYDGDGDDDIYWYAPGAGEDYLWAAQAGQFYGLAAPQVSSSHSAAAGDFNGDGKDEILWSGNPAWVWETFGSGHHLLLPVDVTGDRVVLGPDRRLRQRRRRRRHVVRPWALGRLDLDRAARRVLGLPRAGGERLVRQRHRRRRRRERRRGPALVRLARHRLGVALRRRPHLRCSGAVEPPVPLIAGVA